MGKTLEANEIVVTAQKKMAETRVVESFMIANAGDGNKSNNFLQIII